MTTKILMFTFGLLFSTAGFSQANEKIDKAVNDSKRAENSAKADVRLIDKTVIEQEEKAAGPADATATKNKKKKNRKKCCKKTCSK